MASSTIRAVIDALLALYRARAALASPVDVVDGFPRRPIVAGYDFIAVGGKTEPTAEGTQDPAALGARRRRETYDVRDYCQSNRGTAEDQSVSRDQAFALMAEVEAALRDDPTLSGLVMSAQVGGRLSLQQTDADTADAGSFAEVSFDVSIIARI